jgi:hypothetical protein
VQDDAEAAAETTAPAVPAVSGVEGNDDAEAKGTTAQAVSAVSAVDGNAEAAAEAKGTTAP